MPETVPYADRHDRPDTCCPSTATSVATSTHTGTVTGFMIATPLNLSSGDPNYLRTAIKIHRARRIGTEGCISLGASDWDSLLVDMERTKNKGNGSLPMFVSYTGSAPNPLRNPN